jgi:hypothetical protein
MLELRLLTILIPFCILSLNAQITGFKITNQTSNIVNSTSSRDYPIKFRGKSEKVYKTPQTIQINNLHKSKTKIQENVDQLLNELATNAESTNSGLSEQEIKIKEESIIAFRKELSNFSSQQDSLYLFYTKELLTLKPVNFFFKHGSFRSRAFFDITYDDEGRTFKALGNAGINFGVNSASIYSELVSGNLWIFRVSLGSMISSNNSDSLELGKNEEAFQRLITYGGNAVIKFEYPLFYIHSPNRQFNIMSRLIAKGTFDMPAFGTSTETWAGSASYGVDFYADASTDKGEIRFFSNLNINKIIGTDIFRDNLGIDNSSFTFGQLSLGMVFLENLKISVVLPPFSSEESLRNKCCVLGGQVLR